MMPIKSNELVTIPKKRRVHKPQNESQKRATQENYALFQLRSMISNLHHVHKLQDKMLSGRAALIAIDISSLILDIKTIQHHRKFKEK